MSIATSEQAVVDKVTPRLFVGGEWREASEGGTFAVADPATGRSGPRVQVSAAVS